MCLPPMTHTVCAAQSLQPATTDWSPSAVFHLLCPAQSVEAARNHWRELAKWQSILEAQVRDPLCSEAFGRPFVLFEGLKKCAALPLRAAHSSSLGPANVFESHHWRSCNQRALPV